MTKMYIPNLHPEYYQMRSNELENLSMQSHGDATNAEHEILEEMNTAPIALSDTETKLKLNEKEVKTLYEFLERQYVPYDNENMMNLMRLIRKTYDELVTKAHRAT